jgi:histidine triad (HIT) family protein
MTDCLFCKMVSGEITPDVVYETDSLLAFRDIAPISPVHILVIPKKHIVNIAELEDEDTLLMGELVQAAKKIAKDEGLADSGYRTVMNCREDGGQTVYHMHLHVVGGRAFTWPPG